MSLSGVVLLCSVICLAELPACSMFKGSQKPKQVVKSGPEAGLMSKEGDEVKARLGEPTVISKTNDGHILWVYRPHWKILPNDNGTLYVEFDEGKVVKIFKK